MSTQQVLRAIARHGLVGPAADAAPGPLSDTAWQALLTAAEAQRLTGLVHAAALDGRLDLTDVQHAELRRSHLAFLCANLALDAALADVLDLLKKERIDVRVLKGTAVAHLDYPDPSQRVFGDIDILVRGKDIDRAATVLARLDYVRNSVEPRRGFDRRFGKGATYKHLPSSRQLDVHRVFVLGPLGLRMQEADLWRGGSEFSLAGRRAVALPPEERLLHSCYSIAVGDLRPRLVSLRDLAQVLLREDLDQDRVLQTARRWGGSAVVARAVSACCETLELQDVTRLTAWARDYRPSQRELREIAVYVDPRRNSYRAKALASFPALRGLRDRAAFGLAMAFPAEGFLRKSRSRRGAVG